MLKAIPKTEQAVSNKSYLLNKNSKIVTKKEQQLKQQKSGDNLKTNADIRYNNPEIIICPKAMHLRKTQHPIINKLAYAVPRKGWATTDFYKKGIKQREQQRNKINNETINQQCFIENNNKNVDLKTNSALQGNSIVGVPLNRSAKVKQKLSTNYSSRQTIHPRPPILLNNEFDYLDKSQLLFNKQQLNQLQKYQQINAFWVTQSCYVRIVRIGSKNLQEYEYYQQQESHPGLIKIYGRLKIKFFHFVVTEYLEDSSLTNIFSQFGQCNQRFIKKSLKMLVNGLSTFHSKGHCFNILSPHSIYINDKGQTLIDTTKAVSRRTITKQQKSNYFNYMSPQLLVDNHNGFKNDVWSVGSITLAMIIGCEISKECLIHPYNYYKYSYGLDGQNSSLQNSSASISKSCLKSEHSILVSILKIRRQMLKKQNRLQNSQILQYSQQAQFPLLAFISKNNQLVLSPVNKNRNFRNSSILNNNQKTDAKISDNHVQSNAKMISINKADSHTDPKFKRKSYHQYLCQQMQKLHISEALVDLIINCLRIQVQERFTIRDLLNHPFLKD